jgi:serine phosphatase RsbU (regulator of sigma subunit)
MAPKDMATWVSILGAFGVGVSAHFGVAAKAGDAEKEGEHTRALLEQHVAEAKEERKAQAEEAKDAREQHIRDVEQLRLQEANTRERVIVLEQSTRQILEGQQKMQSVLEASTVLVPTGKAVRR